MKNKVKEPVPPELQKKLRELAKIANNFKIVGDGISGSFKKGYKLNLEPESSP